MDADGRPRKSFLEILLTPLIAINKGFSSLLRHALKDKYSNVTEYEILNLVDESSENGSIENSSAEMITNIFEFDNLTASDVMTHRVNILGLDINATLDDIIYMALDEGVSRIPVYMEDIDTIVGIVIVKDLLCLIGSDSTANFNIKDFLREAVFIPETCTCTDTFKYLTNLKSGMAVVVDEYGGTAGIVTLEDLIEAVMGNIQDEYDEEDVEIKSIGKGKYEIDGTANPDEVMELFGLKLPENHEFDTIAGFVTDLLGYIPENSTTPHIYYNGVRFVVLTVEDNCIRKILAISEKN